MKKKDTMSLTDWRRAHLPGVPHKVLRDNEVRDYVDSHLAVMTFVELERACVERFGERAPSKSSLHRYWSAFYRTSQEKRPRRRRRARKSATPINREESQQ